jgi:hypothetical protein
MPRSRLFFTSTLGIVHQMKLHITYYNQWCGSNDFFRILHECFLVFQHNFTFVFPLYKCARLHNMMRYELFRGFLIKRNFCF